MDWEPIREFSGEIIAWIEHKDNGDIQVRAFSGKILGRYDKAHDCTRDFYGKILANGDCHGMLIGRDPDQ